MPTLNKLMIIIITYYYYFFYSHQKKVFLSHIYKNRLFRPLKLYDNITISLPVLYVVLWV